MEDELQTPMQASGKQQSIKVYMAKPDQDAAPTKASAVEIVVAESRTAVLAIVQKAQPGRQQSKLRGV